MESAPTSVAEYPEYPVGCSVLAKVPGGGAGWFAGTVVGVPASVSATRKPGTVRVVFADGAAADCGLGELRAWQKPDESAWSKRRKVRGGRHVETANRQSAHSSVEQLDVATEEKIARWQSARKAAESLHSVGDPADIIACCRGQAPQAGGYKWRFADPRPKVDAADIDEMIQMDYAIEIQKDNPKKAGTKSADLYDQYKGAGTVKEMLSLGGRRGDVSYDIAHGWITFPDAELNRRFCGADAKEEEEAPPRPEDQLYAGAKKLPSPPSDADEDVEDDE
mmetsp:Transcript_13333/g.45626  ORF Transcript_13333/g.45626 Transcript_13333/m.45626 type:complete len:279 (+) Transcript_13333:78-914(+)